MVLFINGFRGKFMIFLKKTNEHEDFFLVQKTRSLEDLILQKQFRFNHLAVRGIDNEAVARMFSPAILREEFCLFANTIRSGDDYFLTLHERLVSALKEKQPLPVVRFADGEYAFYRYTLGCNGLYKQAESIEAIRKVMPLHLAAMEYLAGQGLFAPLIFPGNSQAPSQDFFSLKKQKRDSTGAEFLDFLRAHQIHLTAENYIPFYVIYAYLSSPEFAAAMNGKKICILNSEYNKESCRNWFTTLNSSPKLEFVDIPQEYVATRWEETKTPIISRIPAGTDLCIVGAGVGALLICKDVAQTLSIPAIDAGHVLNMMNDRVDKSNGARLYTLRKDS
jgi:hypothetical protein